MYVSLDVVVQPVVKLLSHRCGIRSLSLKLDYNFVKLMTGFTQSIPSHRGLEQSVSVHSQTIEQRCNKDTF